MCDDATAETLLARLVPGTAAALQRLFEDDIVLSGRVSVRKLLNAISRNCGGSVDAAEALFPRAGADRAGLVAYLAMADIVKGLHTHGPTKLWPI